MVEAYALAAPPPPSAAVRESGTVFHDLFRTGATDEAVAPLVSALWAAPLPATGEPPQVKPVAAVPLKSRPKPVPSPEPPAAPPAAEAGEPGFFEKLLPRARALFRGRV